MASREQAALRCVLHDILTLALCIEGLGLKWPRVVRRDVPIPQGQAFLPREALTVAALIMFRSLYQYLYRGLMPKTKSQIKDLRISDLSLPSGSAGIPRQAPGFQGFDGRGAFDIDSIHKYVAHLTEARISKSVPQPKDRRAIRQNACLLLKDARALLTDAEKKHGLCSRGRKYLRSLDECLGRLKVGQP